MTVDDAVSVMACCLSHLSRIGAWVALRLEPRLVAAAVGGPAAADYLISHEEGSEPVAALIREVVVLVLGSPGRVRVVVTRVMSRVENFAAAAEKMAPVAGTAEGAATMPTVELDLSFWAARGCRYWSPETGATSHSLVAMECSAAAALSLVDVAFEEAGLVAAFGPSEDEYYH